MRDYESFESLAIAQRWQEFLELCSAVADANAVRSHDGDSLLLLAIRYGAFSYDFGIVNYLFDRGIDVNVVNGSGEHPLLLACEVTSDGAALVELAKACISHGLDVNLSGYAGWTALHAAAAANRLELIEALLQYGADTEIEADIENSTALDLAIRQHCENAVAVLSRSK